MVYLAGGAATRDEFYEPSCRRLPPPSGRTDAAAKFVKESGHRYNERADLPTIKPLTNCRVGRVERDPPPSTPSSSGGARSTRPALQPPPTLLPVIGCRLDLKEGIDPAAIWAKYEDGRTAGARIAHGRGTVIAAGFLPGLAYSPFKVDQTTLDEVWPEGPRGVLALPLDEGLADRQTLRLSEPVVEASLLTGPEGSAIVLANYTYRPIAKLSIRLPAGLAFSRAESTEGAAVRVTQSGGAATLELPLQWTDIVLLPK